MKIWDRGTYEPQKWQRRQGRSSSSTASASAAATRCFRRPAASEKDLDDPPHGSAGRPGRASPMPRARCAPMLARLGELPPRRGRALGLRGQVGRRPRAAVERPRPRAAREPQAEATSPRAIRSCARSAARSARASALLDGEIVALRRGGAAELRAPAAAHARRAARRRSAGCARDCPVTYVAFDLLHLDGRSLLELPYEQRRDAARRARARRARLAHARATTAATARRCSRRRASRGWRASSPSASTAATSRAAAAARGSRSRTAAAQELVIGGWMPGEGRRAGRIGALLRRRARGDRRRRCATPAASAPASRRRMLDELSRSGSSRCASARLAVRAGAARSPKRRALRRAAAASPRSSSASGRSEGLLRQSRLQGAARRQSPSRRERLVVARTRRGRRAAAELVQPATRSCTRRRVHEGRPDRLLRADRAGAAAAPARPPADAQALARRRRGQVLLREALPVAPARLGARRRSIYSRQRAQTDRLLPRAGPADAVVARPTSPRSSCTRRCRSRRRHRATRPTLVFDLDPGPPATGSSSAPRSRSCCASCSTQLGLRSVRRRPRARKGLQVYVPLERARRDLRRARSRSRGRSPSCSSERLPRARRRAHDQAPARRQGAHRLEPERRAQDDGRRLLAARARAPDRLDAAGVGGGRAAHAARRGRPLVFDAAAVLARVRRARRPVRRRCSSCRQELPDL